MSSIVHGRHEMRPEHELLLSCGRVRLEDSTARRVRELLSENLDWSRLVPTAQRHGLIPLLYHHIAAIDHDAVPELAFQQLRDRALATTRRNLRLTAGLIDLLGALDDADIPAMLFKGPALALAAYGNLALRPFSDLDILVRTADLPRTVDLLRSRGFTRKLELRAAQKRAYVQFQYASAFNGVEEQVHVDLHWRFAKRYFVIGLRPQTLWQESTPVPLPGARARTFSPEVLLLLLCWHGAKHGPTPWPRALWVCDVAELIRATPRLDWSKVLEHARRHGGQRILRLGLALAGDLFGAPLPGDVRERIRRDRVVRELAAPIRASLFESADPGRLKDRIRFEIRVRERLRDKLAYALTRLLLPGPRDWTIVPLPRLLAPLYVPLRIVRLSSKSVGRLWASKES